jgi:hypothetical protein
MSYTSAEAEIQLRTIFPDTNVFKPQALTKLGMQKRMQKRYE